jgi:hypothetical protein
MVKKIKTKLQKVDKVLSIDVGDLYGKEDVYGEKILRFIDEFDSDLRRYYTRKESIGMIEDALSIFAVLIIAVEGNVPGFMPKFKTAEVQKVLKISASGCFRNIKVALKLLEKGYFLEMQSVLRMVEQWAECLILVEGNQIVATEILKEGVSDRLVKIALNSSKELQGIYAKMKGSFQKFSKRSHVTKTAIELSQRRGDRQTFICGIRSDEMFRRDSIALTQMAVNAVNLLLRHFDAVPAKWNEKYLGLKVKLEERVQLLKKMLLILKYIFKVRKRNEISMENCL